MTAPVRRGRGRPRKGEPIDPGVLVSLGQNRTQRQTLPTLRASERNKPKKSVLDSEPESEEESITPVSRLTRKSMRSKLASMSTSTRIQKSAVTSGDEDEYDNIVFSKSKPRTKRTTGVASSSAKPLRRAGSKQGLTARRSSPRFNKQRPDESAASKVAGRVHSSGAGRSSAARVVKEDGVSMHNHKSVLSDDSDNDDDDDDFEEMLKMQRTSTRGRKKSTTTSKPASSSRHAKSANAKQSSPVRASSRIKQQSAPKYADESSSVEEEESYGRRQTGRKRGAVGKRSPRSKKSSRTTRGAKRDSSSSDDGEDDGTPPATQESVESLSLKMRSIKERVTRRRTRRKPREPRVEWEIARKTITEDEQSEIRIAFTKYYPSPPNNMTVMARFEQKYGRAMPKKMHEALWKKELEPWSKRWWQFYLEFSDVVRAKKKEKPATRDPALTEAEIAQQAKQYYKKHGDARLPVELSKKKGTKRQREMRAGSTTDTLFDNVIDIEEDTVQAAEVDETRTPVKKRRTRRLADPRDGMAAGSSRGDAEACKKGIKNTEDTEEEAVVLRTETKNICVKNVNNGNCADIVDLVGDKMQPDHEVVPVENGDEKICQGNKELTANDNEKMQSKAVSIPIDIGGNRDEKPVQCDTVDVKIITLDSSTGDVNMSSKESMGADVVSGSANLLSVCVGTDVHSDRKAVHPVDFIIDAIIGIATRGESDSAKTMHPVSNIVEDILVIAVNSEVDNTDTGKRVSDIVEDIPFVAVSGDSANKETDSAKGALRNANMMVDANCVINNVTSSNGTSEGQSVKVDHLENGFADVDGKLGGRKTSTSCNVANAELNNGKVCITQTNNVMVMDLVDNSGINGEPINVKRINCDSGVGVGQAEKFVSGEINVLPITEDRGALAGRQDTMICDDDVSVAKRRESHKDINGNVTKENTIAGSHSEKEMDGKAEVSLLTNLDTEKNISHLGESVRGSRNIVESCVDKAINVGFESEKKVTGRD